MFASFVATKAKFVLGEHEVVQAGDLALHITDWQMTGQAPDAMTGRGLSVAVSAPARRVVGDGDRQSLRRRAFGAMTRHSPRLSTRGRAWRGVDPSWTERPQATPPRTVVEPHGQLPRKDTSPETPAPRDDVGLRSRGMQSITRTVPSTDVKVRQMAAVPVAGPRSSPARRMQAPRPMNLLSPYQALREPARLRRDVAYLKDQRLET
jgi:hypothetical protein